MCASAIVASSRACDSPLQVSISKGPSEQKEEPRPPYTYTIQLFLWPLSPLFIWTPPIPLLNRPIQQAHSIAPSFT